MRGRGRGGFSRFRERTGPVTEFQNPYPELETLFESSSLSEEDAKLTLTHRSWCQFWRNSHFFSLGGNEKLNEDGVAKAETIENPRSFDLKKQREQILAHSGPAYFPPELLGDSFKAELKKSPKKKRKLVEGNAPTEESERQTNVEEEDQVEEEEEDFGGDDYAHDYYADEENEDGDDGGGPEDE